MFWEEPIAYVPWYDTGHIENDAYNNSAVFMYTVFLCNNFLLDIVPLFI
jgi:hypothetical protein